MEKKDTLVLPTMDGITITERVFKNKRNLDIYTLSWVPKHPKALLFFVHGLGEHINRYHEFSRHFAELGFAVFALDQEGHGRSQGLKKQYFNRYSGLIEDILQLIDDTIVNYADLPVFAMGHSMGSCSIIQCAFKRPNFFRGVVLSGPAIGLPADVSNFLHNVCKPLSALFPSAGVVPLDLNSLCSDKNIVQEYQDDPLVWKGSVKARVATELLNTAVNNLDHAKAFRTPFLICQGQKDVTVDPKKVQSFFDKCDEEDKQIVYFKESMHDILFDVEHKEVLDVAGKWLVDHIDKVRSGGEKIVPQAEPKKLNSAL